MVSAQSIIRDRSRRPPPSHYRNHRRKQNTAVAGEELQMKWHYYCVGHPVFVVGLPKWATILCTGSCRSPSSSLARWMPDSMIQVQSRTVCGRGLFFGLDAVTCVHDHCSSSICLLGGRFAIGLMYFSFTPSLHTGVIKK